jgi:uncharacterized protein YhbP (UPF0306 family)
MRQLETVVELLRSQSTLALATCDAGGTPRVAALFYLPVCVPGEGLRLYWFSSSASRHSRNLRRDPIGAVTIYRSTDQWKQIRGVQMRGRVEVVNDRARRESIAREYAERFRLGAMLDAAMSRSRLYEFQPCWLRYTDNVERLGYKFERWLPPSQTASRKS